VPSPVAEAAPYDHGTSTREGVAMADGTGTPPADLRAAVVLETLVADYPRSSPPAPGASPPWDEALGEDGLARTPYRGLLQALGRLSPTELAGRVALLADAYADQGVTFSLSGVERPFPLDPVPRVITPEEWAVVERGVVQRVRALELFLDDLYSRAEVLKDGIVPRSVVLSSPHFHRAAHGFRPPHGVRIHVSGIDLVRDEQGGFCVLEDNLRTPSGVSYVIENRQAVARALPDLFGVLPVRPVDDYPVRLLSALRATAPGVDDPTVVVLTPGVHNAAYVEHTLLARAMGVELVEGRDLLVRDGIVFMRTTDGDRRVDVIYRRIDDDFLDPVHFRADSLLGAPGLLGAVRFGSVSIANAVGNGVADDKLTYTYVPDLIRYYLGEEPVLPNVTTYRLGDPDHRGYALDHLDELVLKPTDASGGKGIVIGPQATRDELDTARRTVLADPRQWIAQPVVALSTAPTFVEGRLEPRHIDLRPFAVNDGSSVWVLPGGLTRVALPRGSLVVNSSQGGGSKDTWVLADPLAAAPAARVEADLPPSPGAPPLVSDLGIPLVPLVSGPEESSDPKQQQQQQQQQDGRSGGEAPGEDAC
jgi:uncharacterized circularly permuted ATP-grasp superfamily protein